MPGFEERVDAFKATGMPALMTDLRNQSIHNALLDPVWYSRWISGGGASHGFTLGLDSFPRPYKLLSGSKEFLAKHENEIDLAGFMDEYRRRAIPLNEWCLAQAEENAGDEVKNYWHLRASMSRWAARDGLRLLLAGDPLNPRQAFSAMLGRLGKEQRDSVLRLPGGCRAEKLLEYLGREADLDLALSDRVREVVQAVDPQPGGLGMKRL
jgi:hypothetical protein